MNTGARRFSEEEDRYILTHHGLMLNTALAAVLGRSPWSIETRYRVLKRREGRKLDPPNPHEPAHQSICWRCANAVPNVNRIEELGRKGAVGCSWSIAFVPVEGWEAIETVKSDYKSYQSFDVRRCPMWREG